MGTAIGDIVSLDRMTVCKPSSDTQITKNVHAIFEDFRSCKKLNFKFVKHDNFQ